MAKHVLRSAIVAMLAVVSVSCRREKADENRGHSVPVIAPPPRSAPLPRPATTSAPASPAPEVASKGQEQARAPSLPEPQMLLLLEQSAYGVSLHLQEDSLLLLSPGALYRVPISDHGKTDTLAALPIPVGLGATIIGAEILYWRDGLLQSMPQRGGEARVVASVEQEPQRILAGEAGIAWLRHGEGTEYVIEKLGQRGSSALYTTTDRLHSPVMIDDWLFFVQSHDPSRYRIMGVSMRNGKVLEGKSRSGRTPSMLVAQREYLYYYDGPLRAVRRLSASFEEDTLISKGTICSPLAVSDRVVCAQVGGLFAINEHSGEVHPLAQEHRGPITNLAATSDRVAWITDLGKGGGLAVSSVPLPPL